jgi:hypothetical protein
MTLQRRPHCSCGGGCPRCESGKAPDDEQGDVERTKMTAAATGNKIDFTFDPSTTSPKPKCDQIAIVQVLQMTADGTAMKPGTYFSGFKPRDAIALADGRYIDSSSSGTPAASPYYTWDTGTEGSSNGASSNSTCSDTPDTGGGDKGFKSEAAKSGWSTVLYKFETFGYCAKGTDCGKWYEGVSWTYTKTADDAKAGKVGVSAKTGDLAVPGAAADSVKAFEHFNKVQGFTPCPKAASSGP